MAAQSFLAKLGIRMSTLGTAASLAFAMPLAEGSYDTAAHTAANRTGFFGNQTAGSEQFGFIVGGATAPIITHVDSIGQLGLVACTAGAASLNVPQGTAPTLPNNGDFWFTSAGVWAQVNGVTYQLTGTSGSGAITAGQVAYGGTAAGTIVGSATFTFAPATGAAISNAAGSIAYELKISNTSTGTAAQALVSAYNDSNKPCQLQVCNTSFTTSGVQVANSGGLYFGGSGNLWIWPQSGSVILVANSAGTKVAGFTMSNFGGITLTPVALSTGARTALTLTAAANTTQTSGTEIFDCNWNLARSVQWTTTTPTTQRAFIIQAPTYTCDTAAQTITTAATFAVTGAPVAGANVSITTPLALWVQNGNALFAVNVTVSGSGIFNGANGIAINQGANASGVRSCLAIAPASGTLVTSGSENPMVTFATHTQQWTTTVPTTQREWRITAPTYTCDTATQTITTAATFAITGAPAAGANVTITNAYAFWVQAGTVALGTGAIATSATSGYTAITSCAGQPTGVPNIASGLTALQYDSTNHKFWVYDTINTAWKGVAVA
jgi:hypothetical protein